MNGLVELNYSTQRWGLGAECYFAARQDKVAEFNGESNTDGYAVFNLNGYLQVANVVRLSAGVDNLADNVYSDHLAGLNRVAGNADLAVGERLPGYGRSFFARLDLTF